MNIKKLSLALILTLFYSAASLAMTAAYVSVKAGLSVGVCTGNNASCNTISTVNAIGDPFRVDVSKTTVNKLGSITSDKKIALALPSKDDEVRVFSITPTKGELTDKNVHFAFKRSKGRPGTQFAGLEVIDIFRQDFDNDKGLWFRAGRFTSDEGYPSSFEFTFKPNGNATITDPETKQDKVLEFGIRNLAKS